MDIGNHLVLLLELYLYLRVRGHFAIAKCVGEATLRFTDHLSVYFQLCINT